MSYERKKKVKTQQIDLAKTLEMFSREENKIIHSMVGRI